MRSCNYDLEVKPPETWGTKVGLGEFSRSGTINALVSTNEVGPDPWEQYSGPSKC